MKKRMGDFFRGNTRQLIQICFLVAACILPWILDFNRLFDSWYTNTDASPDNWLWHLALSYGNPAISILLVGLAWAAVRKWNSEYVMNKNSAYHDYSYVWYWFCAKILGIKKCNLILVPISTQFKLVIRGTFPDYPLDLNDYPSISEENACLIAVSNVDAGTDEVNLVIEDTYEILDSQIPEEKRSLQTIRVSRCDGTNNRHFSQKLIDAVNGTVRQKGSIPRLNVFATTNPMNSKQIAMNAFVQGGRGNVAHLYVFQQESKGNRVFNKRGRKIY